MPVHNNCRVQEDIDVGVNGGVDKTTVQTYDRYGRLEHYKHDANGDGVFEIHARSAYDWTGEKMCIGVDITGDGYIDRGDHVSRNNKGQAVAWVRFDIAREMGATPTRVVHYEYDAQDRMRREVADVDGDGSRFSIREYKYVGDQLYRVVIDDNNDGMFDGAYFYEWRADGLLSARHYDEGVDGTIDHTIWFRYNENTQLVEVVSGSRRSEYTYDDAGRLRSWQSVIGDVLNNQIDYSYDERGFLTTKEIRGPEVRPQRHSYMVECD